MSFKSSYIAFHKHFNYIVMHFRCVLYMLSYCMLVGLDWAEPMMFLNLHVICSCIFVHTYLHFLIFLYTTALVLFWFSLSHSLHSCVSLLLWHLNANLLRPITLCILGHLLPLTPHLLLFDSVMRTFERTSQRTFVNETFIWNVTSLCQTFLTLTYHYHSQQGLGVTLWHPGHLSICDHIGVLLQYA